ncbi:hypothetical protein GCM10010472_68820 [Pseudonocardia halophobica]|uniref:Uncharacterized protein n=1 Tax=Pseudonocardia halophobica TaxID=29401 RepID=A0A9W6L7K4_9PSEU|nr:hypothetical protein GCM10017577_36900 [Pseudonocardia halophobica]
MESPSGAAPMIRKPPLISVSGTGSPSSVVADRATLRVSRHGLFIDWSRAPVARAGDRAGQLEEWNVY